MVVVAIIAGAVALSLPYLSNRNTKTKAALREFIVLSRNLHTKAKLNGAVYRLVIELQPLVPSDENIQTYWVERANSSVVISESEEAETMARLKDAGDKPSKDPRGFAPDPEIIKSPKELPAGLKFSQVELTRIKNPITEGRAYIHYLPQGLVDEAAIHIEGEEGKAWTISIHPLTGKAELINQSRALKELRDQ